jgi:hypothetical protein
MKPEWQKLYESMEQEIACCKLEQPDLRRQVERCFQICEQYWGTVEKELEGYEFADGGAIALNQELTKHQHNPFVMPEESVNKVR